MFGLDEKELKIFLERSLNEKERKILLKSSQFQGESFSSTARKLNLPKSTAKYTLKKLKKKKLLDFGDSENPGKPLTFTTLGKTFFKILDNSIKGGDLVWGEKKTRDYRRSWASNYIRILS